MNRIDEPNWPTRVLVVMRATSHELKTHGHPWAATTPVLCQFLLNAGFEVELSNNLERILNPDPAQGLPSFDAVVFHGKIEQRDDAAVAALRKYVEGGKGLVVIHIASASFEGSEDWKDLIGSVWIYGPGKSTHPEPAAPIRIRVTDSGHPIMAGLPSEFMLAKEELYQQMGIGSTGPGMALAEGTDERDGVVTTEPVAFVLERGRGRVFHMYLGHFISTHLDGRFQKMITQGIEWAARR